MTIRPIVSVEPIRAGIAVRAREIGLACHGRDEQRAMVSMRHTLGIWARMLESEGDLEGVLARCGVLWDAAGTGIVIEPAVSPVTA
jgi:hypothetical protein